MLGLDNHDHSGWVQLLHQRFCYLSGEAFLNLRAFGQPIDQPGELGKSRDFSVFPGDVPDVRVAKERHQMVLAGGVERDVSHHDQLRVLLAEGLVQHLGGVVIETRKDFLVSTSHSGGGFLQSFAVWVLPYRVEQFPDGGFRASLVKFPILSH